MRIAGFRSTSLFDGIGINFVIFTQGCGHHCKNCQNPSTWDLDGGTEMSVGDIEKLIEPYIGFITGITFSGGDPVEQLDEVTQIARWAAKKSLKVTLYTGYSLNELSRDDIDCFDFIIDGEYVDELPSAPFRGSSNQMMCKHVGDSWIKVKEDDVQ